MAEILVLQHVAPETAGRIGDAVAAEGHRLRVVRSFAGEPVPKTLEEVSGLVVMGGPMGVYERDRFPFLHDELRLIERALRAERPLLGVCLGSQLLAHALGADVRPGPKKEIGWHGVMLREAAATDPLLSGVPGAFTAFHWHGDVFDLPGGAAGLARSAQTAWQAFRYGRNAWGLLFHMEVTEAMVKGMVEAFPSELAGAGLDGSAILAQAGAHLPLLERIASRAFARWAELLG
jgi:GMP synthase (glutamine-hydrolysing)